MKFDLQGLLKSVFLAIGMTCLRIRAASDGDVGDGGNLAHPDENYGDLSE